MIRDPDGMFSKTLRGASKVVRKTGGELKCDSYLFLGRTICARRYDQWRYHGLLLFVEHMDRHVGMRSV